MKTSTWIIVGCAAAVGLWYYLKNRETAETDDDEEEPDPGYSADSMFDVGGDPGMSHDQQVATIVEALDHSKRSQMAASTGAYQTILDEVDSVDPSTLSYEKRSQMAASQRGSAVIRAQAISPATPVKAPATKTTTSTAAKMPTMRNNRAPSAAQIAAMKKAQRAARKKKQPFSKAISKLNNTVDNLRANLASIKPVAVIPTQNMLSGAIDKALSNVSAATTASNMNITSAFKV